jgi:hypothetical protein
LTEDSEHDGNDIFFDIEELNFADRRIFIDYEASEFRRIINFDDMSELNSLSDMPALLAFSGKISVHEHAIGPTSFSGASLTFFSSDGRVVNAIGDSAGEFRFNLPLENFDPIRSAVGDEIDLFEPPFTTLQQVNAISNIELSGRVEGTRLFDRLIDPEITAQDALEVLRLSVGMSPSFGTARGAHYVAADINGDGQVNAQDALEVLRFALGLESAYAPRWVFLDEHINLDEMGLSAANSFVQTGASIDLLNTDAGDLSLTAILLGNIDSVA